MVNINNSWRVQPINAAASYRHNKNNQNAQPTVLKKEIKKKVEERLENESDSVCGQIFRAWV